MDMFHPGLHYTGYHRYCRCGRYRQGSQEVMSVVVS